MRTKAFTLIVIGFGWLALDGVWMFGNVVLRETRLGVIAQFFGQATNLGLKSYLRMSLGHYADRVDRSTRCWLSPFATKST